MGRSSMQQIPRRLPDAHFGPDFLLTGLENPSRSLSPQMGTLLFAAAQTVSSIRVLRFFLVQLVKSTIFTHFLRALEIGSRYCDKQMKCRANRMWSDFPGAAGRRGILITKEPLSTPNLTLRASYSCIPRFSQDCGILLNYGTVLRLHY